MGRTAHGGLFARPSARDRAAVAAAIDRLGIAELAERPVTEISGGERQLVLVARALAQEPRAVMLDEPTASLDFGNQGRVLREIRGLARAGLAVLFTTHDPNHAVRFADRALLVRDGGTLAQGPAQELIERVRLAELYGTEVEELTDAATGYRGYCRLDAFHQGIAWPRTRVPVPNGYPACTRGTFGFPILRNSTRGEWPLRLHSADHPPTQPRRQRHRAIAASPRTQPAGAARCAVATPIQVVRGRSWRSRSDARLPRPSRLNARALQGPRGTPATPLASRMRGRQARPP